MKYRHSIRISLIDVDTAISENTGQHFLSLFLLLKIPSYGGEQKAT